MLKEVFPKVHSRYLSLPILGATLDGFAEFLVGEGYSRGPVRHHLRTARRIDERLQWRGCRAVAEITRDDLHACAPPGGRSQDEVRGRNRDVRGGASPWRHDDDPVPDSHPPRGFLM